MILPEFKNCTNCNSKINDTCFEMSMGFDSVRTNLDKIYQLNIVCDLKVIKYCFVDEVIRGNLKSICHKCNYLFQSAPLFFSKEKGWDKYQTITNVIFFRHLIEKHIFCKYIALNVWDAYYGKNYQAINAATIQEAIKKFKQFKNSIILK